MRRDSTLGLAMRPSASRRRSTLVSVGLGISIVPASLQRIQMDGLVYRRLRGPTRLIAPLMLASRRGDPSVAVGHYLDLVKRAAKDFSVDEFCRSRKRKIIRSSRAGS
jgi:hypothetical protein